MLIPQPVYQPVIAHPIGIQQVTAVSPVYHSVLHVSTDKPVKHVLLIILFNILKRFVLEFAMLLNFGFLY